MPAPDRRPYPEPIPLSNPVELPGGHRLDPRASSFRWHILPAPVSPAVDLEAKLARRLRTPTAGPPLRLRPPVLVLLPDATRRTFVREMVAGVTEHILEARLEVGDVELLVAAGLHRAPRRKELAQLLGDDLLPFPIRYHDADDPGLVSCGTTRRGTPVELPRAVLDVRTLIVVGGITPHYFAGWTGGFKGVVPGAAGRATITANHRLAVDPIRSQSLHAACREGTMRGNPVAADLTEAARYAPAPFLVNVVVGPDGEPRAVVTGSVPEAHLAGVRLARRAIQVPLRPYPLVLVAAGDPGRERDWIQAHKVVRQGGAAVADGGTLIAIADCPDGIGSSTLLEWFAVPESRLAGQVASRYTLHGHTALAMRALTRRIRVILVSRLNPDDVHAMGMTPAASLAEALANAASSKPAIRSTSPPPAPSADMQALLLPRAGTFLPIPLR